MVKEDESCDDDINIISEECVESLNTIENSNLISQVVNTNERNLKKLRSESIITEKFNKIFIKDNYLLDSKERSIPLHLIYETLYKVNHNNKNNFITSLYKIKNDYNIMCSEKNNITPPQYFQDPYNFSLKLFNSQDQGTKDKFLNELEQYPKILEYTYTYTHPMKNVFMGPTKLEMKDDYKIIFVSPICLIVEKTTYISGFMLMDSFVTTAQYTFDSDLSYSNKKFYSKTKLTAKFGIEFIRDVWFRNKIEKDGMVENEEYIGKFMHENITKELKYVSLKYFDCEEKFIYELNSKLNLETIEKIESTYSSDSDGSFFYITKEIDIKRESFKKISATSTIVKSKNIKINENCFYRKELNYFIPLIAILSFVFRNENLIIQLILISMFFMSLKVINNIENVNRILTKLIKYY